VLSNTLQRDLILIGDVEIDTDLPLFGKDEIEDIVNLMKNIGELE